ncbi:hypothetical protein J6590_066190 [Homalodisca vitripennis]|nr:hypothetical protein J6590_066190 [Homalodisca vitripennis]
MSLRVTERNVTLVRFVSAKGGIIAAIVMSGRAIPVSWLCRRASERLLVLLVEATTYFGGQ